MRRTNRTDKITSKRTEETFFFFLTNSINYNNNNLFLLKELLYTSTMFSSNDHSALVIKIFFSPETNSIGCVFVVKGWLGGDGEMEGKECWLGNARGWDG